jgi:hypothetical protein
MSPEPGILGRLSVLSSGGGRKAAQEQSNRDQITREIAAPFITFYTVQFVCPRLAPDSTSHPIRSPEWLILWPPSAPDDHTARPWVPMYC